MIFLCEVIISVIFKYHFLSFSEIFNIYMFIDYVFKPRLTTPVSNFYWKANEIYYDCPSLSRVLQFGIFNSVSSKNSLVLQKTFVFRIISHRIRREWRDKKYDRPMQLLIPIEKENILTRSVSIQILKYGEENDNTMYFLLFTFQLVPLHNEHVMWAQVSRYLFKTFIHF